MMLIDYPHSKNTHNFFLKLNLLNKNLQFQESFTTPCKWGVMYMTSKTKL